LRYFEQECLINPDWIIPAAPPNWLRLSSPPQDLIISNYLGGRIITWNASAERIYGYPAAEAIDHPMTMLIPPDRPDEEADILDDIRRTMRFQHFEAIWRHKMGGRPHLFRAASGTTIRAAPYAPQLAH
jgi:PAS domain S-box-containing protein